MFFKKIFNHEPKAIYGYQHLLKYLKSASIQYDFRGEKGLLFNYGDVPIGCSMEKETSVILIAFMPQSSLEKIEMESLCEVLNKNDDDGSFVVRNDGRVLYAEEFVPAETTTKEEWEQVLSKFEEKFIIYNEAAQRLLEPLYGYQHLLKYLKAAEIPYDFRGETSLFFNYGDVPIGCSMSKEESTLLVAFMPQSSLEKIEMESLCNVLNKNDDDGSFVVMHDDGVVYTKTIIPTEAMTEEEWEQILSKLEEKFIIYNDAAQRVYEHYHGNA